jgi:nitrite reductase (NO-forming)
MSDHNLTARIWASAALLPVPLIGLTDFHWWLPLHLALIGAVTQAIVGGQLMFSATLGLSRGPSRRITLTQLSLLNIGAALVIGGRVFGSEVALALGATTVTLVVGWVLWLVDGLWRRSVNRRFAITGIFYRMAGASIVIEATIGGALGIGAIGDASSFVAYRNLHMTLNVLGWSGLTVVGTVITLLPTIIHVRAPAVGNLRASPG